MYGLTAGEIQGTIPQVPLLDRLADNGCEALTGMPSSQPPAVSPIPVLRLPAAERTPWLESYIDQLLTRDLAEMETHRDPQLLRRYLESYTLNTAGVTDHRTIYEAAGVAKGTGDA